MTIEERQAQFDKYMRISKYLQSEGELHAAQEWLSEAARVAEEINHLEQAIVEVVKSGV